MEPDWSLLPVDLLESISKKMASATDYVSFRAVCSSWRSATPSRPRHLPSQFPWLMVPSPPLYPRRRNQRSFFDLADDKAYALDLPAACEKRVCGSSHGFLVLEEGPSVSLLNPVTKAQIELPAFTGSPNVLSFPPFEGEGREYALHGPFLSTDYHFADWGNGFIKKCVLSSDPSTSGCECVAMAIIHGQWNLAFCRVGDESWTIIEEPAPNDNNIDVTYHEGRFCSFTTQGRVTFFDVGPPWRAMVYSTALPAGGDQMRLVENSSGELLMVAWNSQSLDADEAITRYSLSKFDLNHQPEWLTVDEMGDCMLFLGGNNQCFALSADCFGKLGWRGNRIYYTCPFYLHRFEHGNTGSHGVRSFSVEDGGVAQVKGFLGLYILDGSPPVWVTPNL